MVEVYDQLEAEYCPPLDPALLSAILSDFDLAVESNIQSARSILDPLKESALLEEQAGFDASGTGSKYGGLLVGTTAESCPDTSVSLSRETDLTSVSNGLSSLDLEHRADDGTISPGAAQDIEELDEDSKIQLLLEVFQDRVSSYDARHTLRKCDGKWHKAMDVLLNHVYIDTASNSDDGFGISAKGIDAFSEDQIARRARKRKAKNKAWRKVEDGRSSSLPISLANTPPPQMNKWETSAKDIEYIASRINLPAKTVTSKYYSNGASVSRTVAAILKDSVDKDDDSDDPILAVNAHDLGVDFPSISPKYAAAIVRLTHPSTAVAHELAKALVAEPSVPDGGLQIIPIYGRPTAAEIDPGWQSESRKARSLLPQSEHSTVDALDAAERASALATARSTALSKAYAAHRKAKSDRLMGGAAAYYGQLSQEYGAMSLSATAAAADALADSQSTSTQLDLHGIDVLNAVRIAQEKVEHWWTNLGEHRVNGRPGAEERQSGYTIVVGLGRHSEGGKGKLGPAVSKVLKNDGWRVELAGAVILVKGRARSR